MQITKSNEELKARRERVKFLQRQGQVMNDSMRTQIQKQRKYFAQLEEKADLILAGINPTSNRKPQPTNQNQSNVDQGSFRRLSQNDKYDKLAVEASKIIEDLVR